MAQAEDAEQDRQAPQPQNPPTTEEFNMSYIVMGIDECGSEFRPSEYKWSTTDKAGEELLQLKELYEECRFHVEQLRDKGYYQRQAMARFDNDEQDLY